MTVKELKEILNKFDENLEVVFWGDEITYVSLVDNGKVKYVMIE